MKIRHLVLSAIVFASSFLSCGKPDETSPNPTPPPAVDSSPGVYVAGFEKTSLGINVAKYWKDGTPVVLTDGIEPAGLYDIAVYGNQVYACGYKYVNGVSKATYWVNGESKELPDANRIMKIFIDQGNVYMVGKKDNQAVGYVRIWRNGLSIYHYAFEQAINLNDIFVKDGDIYIAGDFTYSVAVPHGGIWKNNVLQDLGTNGSVSFTNCVQVVAGNVYACGNERVSNVTNYRAKFWKNGVGTFLTDGSKNEACSKMLISGNDVYIAGTVVDANYKSTARYWKNGVSTLLPSVGSSQAIAIALQGNDVIYAGYDNYNAQFTNKAVTWKNGVETALTDGSKMAEAHSVFVKQ